MCPIRINSCNVESAHVKFTFGSHLKKKILRQSNTGKIQIFEAYEQIRRKKKNKKKKNTIDVEIRQRSVKYCNHMQE